MQEKQEAQALEFDARRYVIKVQGGAEYLPVAARLIWFRQVHPDWSIVTEALQINLYPEDRREPFAIFKASILNAEGRVISSGTKYEDRKGFPDFIEKAETSAIGRALAMCGFGTQFAPELNEGTKRLNDAPQRNNRADRQAGQSAGRTYNRTTQEPEAPKQDDTDLPERKEAYDRFAAEAYNLGFDVAVKQGGQMVYSFMKIGPLLQRAANCERPAMWKDWFPAVAIIDAALAALPSLQRPADTRQRAAA